MDANPASLLGAVSTRPWVRLGERLERAGLLRSEDLVQALALQKQHSGRLGTILVRIGAVSEQTLFESLSEQLEVSLLSFEDVPLGEVLAQLTNSPLPGRWLLDKRVLYWRDPQGVWHFASDDILDQDVGETLASLPPIGPLAWHLVTPSVLDQCLTAVRQRDAEGPVSEDARALRAMAEDAPVIALVNNLLAQAVEARASDVHVEPGEREMEIRFRIDGVLHHRLSLPMARYPATASRLKLIAHLDIGERRLPQDGHIGMRVAGVDLDVRVSCVPAVHGESIVLRLLPKKRSDLDLGTLGLSAAQRTTFAQWLDWPNGLVLVTGPTGSGKSTTLYSALAAMQRGERKIVTVEDPVELRLPRVVQIQVHAEIGYSFARALRAILRHDPDVIMIGEIRDRETAEIAVQAALTGHLVLATLHTNDALSAVTRLVDMGVEPFLLGAALRGVMAQRLVRRVCSSCAQAEPADRPTSAESITTFETAGAMRGMGCPQCQHTGYKGRIGLYELVPVSAALQHLVSAAAPFQELVRAADAEGRRSLLDDGMSKVHEGLTTLAEVLSVAGAQEEPT